MADESLHVFIRGRVQGVGFRFATREQASDLGLRGWVRNLSDGRVEARFSGPRDRLERLLDWCNDGPPLARVDDVEAHFGDADDDSGVRIR